VAAVGRAASPDPGDGVLVGGDVGGLGDLGDVSELSMLGTNDLALLCVTWLRGDCSSMRIRCRGSPEADQVTSLDQPVHGPRANPRTSAVSRVGWRSRARSGARGSA